MFATSTLLFVHLLSFAAFLGAGFAQHRLMKRSRADGLAPSIAAEHERLAAGLVTKIELPAIVGSVASGIGFIVQNPAVMKLGWLHGKLACVLALLVLSHLEMFNARKIVKVRAAGGPDAQGAIDGMKRRHATYGTAGALLVLAVLVFVTFVRLG